MKIGLVHFRVGETDGVSLEMEKMRQVLMGMGHDVVYIAGSLGKYDGLLMDSIEIENSLNNYIIRNAYDKLHDYSPAEFKRILENYGRVIEGQITEIIQNEKIDIFIIHNIWSLGWNLSAASGFLNALKKTGTRAIGHHHDFYWERELYSRPTLPLISRWLETYFPPKDRDVKHITINTIACDKLKEFTGISSTVLPNVFDFSQPRWKKDDYNRSIRQEMGIGENDLVFLQATRVVARKAIELAIDFIEVFNKNYFPRLKDANHQKDNLYTDVKLDGNSNVHFVICGFSEAHEQDYMKALEKKAENCSFNVHFKHKMVTEQRQQNPKTYSLWDLYTIADVITYPSLLEGFGNQLLEAVFAKKLIVGYEYPVFKTDIKPLGVDIVSLGDGARPAKEKVKDGDPASTMLYEIDGNIIDHAAERIYGLLADREKSTAIVEKNFKIGVQEFSYDTMSKILEGILNEAMAYSNS